MPKLVTAIFKYKKIYDDPVIGEVLRPIVPIEVTKFGKNGDEVSERQMALIDSGADFCMFSGEFGELLGIDVKKGKEHVFSGVGGSPLKGYLHRVGLSVAPLPTINVDAVFSYDVSDQNVAILGQRCFFDHYSINFRHRQREIIIKNG